MKTLRTLSLARPLAGEGVCVFGVLAYAEALSIMTKGLESLPRPGSEDQRRLAEEWLHLARMGKDGTVAALNQGFELEGKP